jgi:hypothetical protein
LVGAVEQAFMVAYFRQAVQVQADTKIMGRIVLQDCKDHLEG